MGRLSLINQSRLTNLYRRAVQPLSQDEDTARREFILKILLVWSLHLAGLALLIASLNWLWSHYSNAYIFQGSPPYVLLLVFLTLGGIYCLSHKQKIQLAAYLFLISLWLPTAFTSWHWGAFITQGVLMYALIIVFAGILIESRVAIITAILTGFYLITINQLHNFGWLTVDQTWRQKLPGLGSTITLSATFVFLSLISWLSNREMKQALQRARDSKKALSKQLALFHDIRNPLTSAWLNVENAQQCQQVIKAKNQQELQAKLKATLSSLEQVGELLARSKTELPLTQEFSPKLVIDKTLELLQPQARQHQVKLTFKNQIGSFKLEGDPFKFKQIVSNLVTNAIEASQDQKQRSVKIRLRLNQQTIIYKSSTLVVVLPSRTRLIFLPLSALPNRQKTTLAWV